MSGVRQGAEVQVAPGPEVSLSCEPGRDSNSRVATKACPASDSAELVGRVSRRGNGGTGDGGGTNAPDHRLKQHMH